MTNAPGNGVSVNFMSQRRAGQGPDPIPPKKIPIDLCGPQQILKLFQTRKAPSIEEIGRQVDLRKDIMELLRAPACIPIASEIRQLRADLLKRDPVAAVVGTLFTKRQTATRKNFCHNLGNLLDRIVMT